jgi:NAD(P)-dependent dehydrogenase (short-subunit alcohol dehydrogenase family)
MRRRAIQGVVMTAAAVGAAIWAARRLAPRIDLDGRVALVTGGARGLGLLVAEELARRGAKVAVCARDPAEVERAIRRLSRTGAEIFGCACDLGDRGAAESFVTAAVARFGRLDVVVNDAGVMSVAPHASLAEGAIRDVLAANFWSAVHVTRAALPELAKQGGEGRLVNVTSIGGRVALPHMLPYNVSKAAMLAFSSTLAAELGHPRAGQPRVRVTTVVPGPMRTGSIYAAEVGGRAREEIRWFSLISYLPLASVSAERAARRVVLAIERGDGEVHVGLGGRAIGLLQGVAPRLTAALLGALNRFLMPEPGTSGETWRGHELDVPEPVRPAADRGAEETGQHRPARAA